MNPRRRFMGSAALLFVARIAPLLAAKLSKADVQYQDKPRAAGKDCGDCIQFVRGSTGTAVGSCKIVEGEVSVHGYCLAFTPR